MPPSHALDAQALRLGCSRWLSGHRPARSAREALARLAGAPDVDAPLDVYGEGALIDELECEIAALLGKERAVFLHKGMAAQAAALCTWTAGRSAAVVGLHRKSHLELDEALAYERLLGLRGLRLGDGDTPFLRDELEQAAELPEVLVVELPLRRGGFRLPSWSQLCELSAWAREHEVPLHFDGARLWEAAAFYQRPLAEIAALADSVYVSFYKGLGGLAGCALAGSAPFLARARPWITRLAGDVFTLFPYVLSARLGLRRHLPRMAHYRERALGLAAALARLEGVRVAPEPPQVSSFQVHVPGEPARLQLALDEVARRHGFWLASRCVASAVDGMTMIEVVIGDAADDWEDSQAVELMREAIALAARA